MDNVGIALPSQELTHIGELYSGRQWVTRLSKAINVHKKRFISYLNDEWPIPVGILADILLELNKVNVERKALAHQIGQALTSVDSEHPTNLEKIDSLLHIFDEVCISLYGSAWEEEVIPLFKINEKYAAYKIYDYRNGKKPIGPTLWKRLHEALLFRNLQTDQYLQELLAKYPEVNATYQARLQ